MVSLVSIHAKPNLFPYIIIVIIANIISELLSFISLTYSASSVLLQEGEQILSSEGIQQGDPIGPLLFCIIIHKLVYIQFIIGIQIQGFLLG